MGLPLLPTCRLHSLTNGCIPLRLHPPWLQLGALLTAAAAAAAHASSHPSQPLAQLYMLPRAAPFPTAAQSAWLRPRMPHPYTAARSDVCPKYRAAAGIMQGGGLHYAAGTAALCRAKFRNGPRKITFLVEKPLALCRPPPCIMQARGMHNAAPVTA